MSNFDRHATKEAIPVVAQALLNGGVQGCDEFAAGEAVLAAARWAVQITEGDGDALSQGAGVTLRIP